VEFEVDDDLLNKGMVGDIYQECRPGYFNSLMPLREFIQIYPESLSRFKEVEVYFPSTMIPPSLITNVYRVETDIP
jgi:hypothetical protein